MLLPTELLEAIVSEASDNPATLRHLILTCKALVPRSRLCLFPDIVIRTVDQLASSGEFQ